MQVGRCNGHKIDVICHDSCQFVPVVLGPGVAECLRKSAHGFFVRLGLSARHRTEKKQEKTAREVFHFSFLHERVGKIQEGPTLELDSYMLPESLSIFFLRET